jgi:hypothetical protein
VRTELTLSTTISLTEQETQRNRTPHFATLQSDSPKMAVSYSPAYTVITGYIEICAAPFSG